MKGLTVPGINKSALRSNHQAVTKIRFGDHITVKVADTRTCWTIIDRELARCAGAKRTGRTGRMNIAGHRLTGQLMRVEIGVVRSSCKATVEAFVPDEGQPFRKGLLLGMDFLQAAKMKIDAETGEVKYTTKRYRATNRNKFYQRGDERHVQAKSHVRTISRSAGDRT